MNKVILIGNLGKDPVLSATKNGTNVCDFSLATSESFTKDGQKQTRTEWHKVQAWGNTAKNCERFLKKGSKVMVEGKVRTRDYEDKEGQKRYITEIVASNVQFLDKMQGEPQSEGNSEPASGGYGLDDIPF